MKNKKKGGSFIKPRSDAEDLEIREMLAELSRAPVNLPAGCVEEREEEDETDFSDLYPDDDMEDIRLPSERFYDPDHPIPVWED